MPPDHCGEINWPLILKRLGAWTITELPRRYWRGERGGPPPGARLAQDFVQDAAVRALECKSEWSDTESLYELMKAYIRHRISRLSQKHENKDTRLDAFLEKAGDSSWEISTEAETSSKHGPQPGNLFPAEMALFRSQVRQIAHKRLSKDKVARDVYDLMHDGINEPRNISDITGIEIEVIYNVKKRMQRALSREFEELRPTKRSSDCPPKCEDPSEEE